MSRINDVYEVVGWFMNKGGEAFLLGDQFLILSQDAFEYKVRLLSSPTGLLTTITENEIVLYGKFLYNYPIFSSLYVRKGYPGLFQSLSTNDADYGVPYVNSNAETLQHWPTKPPALKCECGSHSVGVDRHADWCQLYQRSN